MVFSGEEGFKGGASAPSLEREVSGMSFSADRLLILYVLCANGDE